MKHRHEHLPDEAFRARVAACKACHLTENGALIVDPFAAVPVDVDLFAEFDEQLQLWHTIRPVRVNLSTCPFPFSMQDTWEPGKYNAEGYTKSLGICDGFYWDGASGGVFDNPATRLNSLVHDIICDLGSDGRYAVPGYFSRHKLYREIGIYQKMPKWRAWLHYIGLLLGNRPYERFCRIHERLERRH